MHGLERTSQVAEVAPREQSLFRSLDVENRGKVRAGDLLAVFEGLGLLRDDRRIEQTLRALERRGLRDELDLEAFCEAVRPDILLVEQALLGGLVIPDFARFSQAVRGIYERARGNTEGSVADYVPQLAQVDPELFGVALCTIDGQRASFGDSLVDFCVQSCTNPISYALALEEHGEDGVPGSVGREPSGRDGAITCASLIQPELDPGARFDHVVDRWRALCGNRKPGFSNPVYQSERQNADRSYALGYSMREHRAFPPRADLVESLELYLQTCAIEVNAEMMSVLAATLANGGVCPTTGERVLKAGNVRHALTPMSSCGTSGELAFEVGLPAMSSASGVLMVVIPNVMGLCIWSPRLDSHGHSVRGLDLCRELVQRFDFHSDDSPTYASEKDDPRRHGHGELAAWLRRHGARSSDAGGAQGCVEPRPEPAEALLARGRTRRSEGIRA